MYPKISCLQAVSIGEEGDAVAVAAAASHLARVHIPGPTSCTAVTMAPNAAWLAASTPLRTFLIVLEPSSPPASPSEGAEADLGALIQPALMPIPEGVPPAVALCFSANSERLYVGDGDGNVTVLDLGPECEEEDRVSVLHRFQLDSEASVSGRPAAGAFFLCCSGYLGDLMSLMCRPP